MREHDRQPAETALIAQRNQQVTATLLINDAAFQPVRPFTCKWTTKLFGLINDAAFQPVRQGTT